MITKIYFPREIIILSRISVFLIDYIIASFLMFSMIIFYKISFTVYMLWIFPLTFLLIMITFSLSMLLSSVNVYFRDVKLVSSFILRFWFFATPVFYSIDKVDIKIKLILFINPLTFIIENLRRVILEARNVIFWQFAIEFSVITLLFIFCYKFFIKMERSFADVI